MSNDAVPAARATAGLATVKGRLEADAATLADHRELGMTWSPMGLLRAPSELIVRGRLAREEGVR
jgi:hypothetical protein